MKDPMPDTEWHLDRRVPVALIFTLLVQMAAAVWFGSQMSSDIKTNVRDIARLDSRLSAQAAASQAQAVQLGRIEENISGMRGDIARLIGVLEDLR